MLVRRCRTFHYLPTPNNHNNHNTTTTTIIIISSSSSTISHTHQRFQLKSKIRAGREAAPARSDHRPTVLPGP